ncbi:MAG: hypothetical protein BZ136_08040 [Methanosphaera sp. rholeuAM74]|nr:MAG: hypothetical protein BZ136_08040 [Methanosphaera sp. rholeuAM74]
MIETKINCGSQTVVLASVRKAVGVDDNCIVQWDVDEDKQVVIVSFRRKRSLFKIIGVVKDDGRDGVEIKKKIAQGEQI